SIALARGSLHDAQVEAETGLRLVAEQHFAFRQLLAVAIDVDVERGELAAAAELAQRGDALRMAEDWMYLDQYLIARGRLRIALGQAREGVSDLMSCGEKREALGLRWPLEWKARAVLGLVSLGEHQQAGALARELVPVARRVGAPGGVGMSLRAAARVTDAGESVKLLEEAVSSLERSSAQLELAYALADLGAALTRAGRRREGRDAERRAIELAGRCGAIVLAETARTELQRGPGRRARVQLTGPD